jgi:hypothetical protein
MNRLSLLAMPLLAAFAAAGARPPMVFDSATLVRHRLEGEESVVVPAAIGPAWSGVRIFVTVSPDGEVTAARADGKLNDEKVDPGPALAAARRWRFRPFRYRGEAVAAQGIVTIDYRTPPKWRDPEAAFPPVDYSSLKIGLARSACYGSCPDYEVTIDGSGAVEFSTLSPPLEGSAEVHRTFGPGGGVLLPGRHGARIGRAELDRLIERFRAARFFGLERDYSAMITDLPTYRLSFETGGRNWSVTDYFGRRSGMPPVVTELEDAVDAAAGTARWVTGDETSVDALRSEGFDFNSRRAAELTAFVAMAGKAPDRMVIDLVEAGVALDQPLVFDSGDPPVPLGETLLLAAAARHRPQLFDYLARRGWLARVPRDRLSAVFAASGGGCDPGTARALVGAGADPKARANGDMAVPEKAGASALITALAYEGPCDGVALGPLVAALIELGVDVNAADDKGRTALYGLEDPDLQEQLLAAGARADVRDKEGRSPAFSSWYDRIVLGLLDAGADPRGRDSYGKTLREQARERGMPAVLAWLDEHRID